MNKENQHAPQNVFDIHYGNPESRLRIEDIVTNIEAIPSSGKSGLLLYGVYGTGKTTLANLLPDAIEQGKTGLGLNSPETFIGCQQGFNGPQVMTLIGNILNVVSFNASGLHYIILDEVDNLTNLAQQSLKSAMNTHRAVFILTTNNIAELDKGLKDRCVLIEMNAGSPEEYLPLAKEIANSKNVVLNDELLLDAIYLANGSFRNLHHSLNRLVRRMGAS
jgi:DNA polymerase III delta prime subunit